jgi:hypothetical protein
LERRNITLSLPVEILRKVEIMAVSRDMSISGLLTKVLSDLVSREDAYSRARLTHTLMIREASDLGTGGYAVCTREELHERRD